jgi:hypothetical protein
VNDDRQKTGGVPERSQKAREEAINELEETNQKRYSVYRKIDKCSSSWPMARV